MTSSGPLILVVDDYQDAREMYAEFLEFSGFRVAQAGNGEEAVAKATALQPNVVLMDLSLPIMDGWEASRRMKADPRTCSIPVVALTGHSGVGSASGEARPQCDAVLIKPCLPEEVLAEVRRLLALQPPVPLQ